MQNFPCLRRTPKHHEVQDKQEEPRQNTTNKVDANDIEGYEEDLTEQRIEGIEALVERLSRTVLELNNKVFKLINDFVARIKSIKFTLKLLQVTEHLICFWSCTSNVISGMSSTLLYTGEFFGAYVWGKHKKKAEKRMCG